MLSFFHWRVPADQIQALIPPQLALDTFDGDAWIGLVPFTMSGVRPHWSPEIPGISAFHETNVRTYVHCGGQSPGVWFFSLDASNSLAVRVARWRWCLPYYRAAMRVEPNGRRVHYQSVRMWPGPPGAGCTIDVEYGDALPSATGNPGRAAPGTLEHFLAERYLLYAVSRDGTLFRGQVHHTPYPLRACGIHRVEEDLVRAAGLIRPDANPHVMYSEGVDVEVFPLRPVEDAAGHG